MKSHPHIPRLLATLLLALTACTAGQAQMLMRQRNHLRDSLQAIMNMHLTAEEYDKAAEEARKVVAVYADLKDGATIQSLTAKGNVAKILYLGKQYAAAAEAYEDAIRTYNRVFTFDIVSPENQYLFADCADCYAKTGRTEEAVAMGKKVVERQRTIDPSPTKELALGLYNLGIYCYHARYFSESLDYTAESLNTFRELAREANEEDENIRFYIFYGEYYIGLSHIELGNIEEAEKSFAECEKMTRDKDDATGIVSFLMARSMHAVTLQSLGKEDEALREAREAEALFEREKENLGSMVGIAEFSLKNIRLLFDSADDGEEPATYEERGNEEDIYQITKYCQKAGMLLEEGNAKGAYEWLCRAWNMKAFKHFEGLSSYPSFMLMKSATLAAMAERETSEREAEDMAAYMAQQLRTAFPYLTEEERADYWRNVENWYSLMLPSITLATPSPRLSRLWYDAALQSKGILLNNTVNIDRLLRHSGNEALKVLQNDWNGMKDLLQQALRKGNTDAADEIRAAIKKLEKRVLREVAQYGNFMDDLYINTDSVRRALRPDEVAVEFVRCTTFGADDASYVALTLRHDYDRPHLLLLFNESTLQQLAESSPLGDLGSGLWDVLWKPIANDCGGTLPRRIFFAADGLLYNLPVEYCTMPDGQTLAEATECYRLSSTRDLARKHQSQKGTGEIALFGGIDYNAGTQDMALANSVTQDRLRLATPPEDLQSLMASRGEDFPAARKAKTGLVPLKGAKEEIDAIDAMLRKEGFSPWVFDSCRATGESVKMMAQTDLRILHFATHGLYVPRGKRPIFRNITTDAEETPLEEDESLSRSALAMAGANTLKHTAQKTDGGESGYLSAYDISLLDLQGLDLAVLSACESGLGDVTGEGVFGLQRGFKKAGTHSLLMSLDKVNDYATKLFMNTFYHSYIALRKTKREALIDALHHVRTTEGGRWNAPAYWAPFILLDGM